MNLLYFITSFIYLMILSFSLWLGLKNRIGIKFIECIYISLTISIIIDMYRIGNLL